MLRQRQTRHNSSSASRSSRSSFEPTGLPSDACIESNKQTGLGTSETNHAEDNMASAPFNITARIGTWSRSNQWIVFALASGACAAFNGVFAKLTTTQLTTTFSNGIARLLHLPAYESVIEYLVRAMFFGLNLAFNGVMWTLFTKALAKGNSTTQVSIMNTSANFVITAVLGLAIFSESLPPLWWAGAAMLVAGNVIIGKKDEGETDHSDGDSASSAVLLTEDGLGEYRRVPSAPGEGKEGDQDDDTDGEEDAQPRERSEDEDVPDLGNLETR